MADQGRALWQAGKFTPCERDKSRLRLAERVERDDLCVKLGIAGHDRRTPMKTVAMTH